MAYQGISTGTGPNQGNGDTLVDGAVKINSNFSEIYNALGDGSTLNFNEKVQDAVGSAINVGIQTGITVTYDDSNNRINFNVSSQIPVGVIVMWSGSIDSIPTGWALCNGSNGTPDLRDRFIIGAGSNYSVAATGGSADAIVVSHSHTISDPGHSHTVPVRSARSTLGSGQSYIQTWPGESTSTSLVSTGITIQSAGSSGINANLPPYYALAFIMRTV